MPLVYLSISLIIRVSLVSISMCLRRPCARTRTGSATDLLLAARGEVSFRPTSADGPVRTSRGRGRTTRTDISNVARRGGQRVAVDVPIRMRDGRPSGPRRIARSRRVGRRRVSGRERHELHETTRRRRQQAADVRRQDRRPEVFARLAVRPEIGTRTRRQQPRAAQPQAHLVRRGPAHLRQDFAGTGP